MVGLVMAKMNRLTPGSVTTTGATAALAEQLGLQVEQLKPFRLDPRVEELRWTLTELRAETELPTRRSSRTWPRALGAQAAGGSRWRARGERGAKSWNLLPASAAEVARSGSSRHPHPVK
jgi:hypothetical protein